MKLEFPGEGDDRFEDFLVAKENKEAYEICRRFASLEMGDSYSLVIHGPSHSGKTHLLKAMAKKASDIVGAKSSVYLDCGRLAGEDLKRDSHGRLEEYLKAMESARFLALDRLEEVSGNEGAASLIFHLYNEVKRKQNGRFAAATRLQPSQWAFPEWLNTRLLWGQVAHAGQVGDDELPEMLVKMAAGMQMTLPPQAAGWLANHLTRDLESLRDVLVKVDHLSLTTGRKVSIPLIKEAIGYSDNS